jgi:hypothetical protein
MNGCLVADAKVFYSMNNFEYGLGTSSANYVIKSDSSDLSGTCAPTFYQYIYGNNCGPVDSSKSFSTTNLASTFQNKEVKTFKLIS